MPIVKVTFPDGTSYSNQSPDDVTDPNETGLADGGHDPGLLELITKLLEHEVTLIQSIGGLGAAVGYTFSTETADADPGAGTIRLNGATNVATEIYVDLTGADGQDVTALLDTFDDSTSPAKGYLALRQADDSSKWAIYRVTGVTAVAGYRKLAVVPLAPVGSVAFADGAALSLSFNQTGDKGETGDVGNVLAQPIAATAAMGDWILLHSLASGATARMTLADLLGSTAITSMTVTTFTATTATVTDLTVSGESSLQGLVTIGAGMQSKGLFLGNVSGEVVIEAGDPLDIYCTIVGDTTFLLAGGTLPGYGHQHLIHYTIGGVGGWVVGVKALNELTYSADLQSTAEAGETRPWTDSNTSLSLNAAVGPDGRTNLTKLIEDAGGAALHLRTHVLAGLSPNQSLTLSVIVRMADDRGVRLEMYDSDSPGNAIGVYFNPSAGLTHTAYANGNGVNTSQTVTALANSCYRVDLYGQPNTAGSNLAFNLLLLETAASTQGTYTGDGTSGFYIGNVQVNPGQPNGMNEVVASRDAVWQGTATDFPSLAAAATGDLGVSVEPDGRIVVQDHTVETL